MKVINFHPNGFYENTIEGDDYKNFCKHLNYIVEMDDHTNLKHIETSIFGVNFIISIDYISEKVILVFQFKQKSEYQSAYDTMAELNYIYN